MKVRISNRKSNGTKSKLTSVVERGGRNDLALQLRTEIDKLALLFDEVKKQSARVQAAADAMGWNFVFDLEASVGKTPGQESKDQPARNRSRSGKVIALSADTRRTDVQQQP